VVGVDSSALRPFAGFKDFASLGTLQGGDVAQFVSLSKLTPRTESTPWPIDFEERVSTLTNTGWGPRGDSGFKRAVCDYPNPPEIKSQATINLKTGTVVPLAIERRLDPLSARRVYASLESLSGRCSGLRFGAAQKVSDRFQEPGHPVRLLKNLIHANGPR
jgi:hypothetical protein